MLVRSVFVLSLFAAAGCAEGAPEAAHAAQGASLIGAKAPPFTAEKVSGEGPASLAEAKGKVVVVDFWATFCAPCKKSFPRYQALVDQFGTDVAVIAVSVDSPDDAGKPQLVQFAKDAGAKFAIVWDKDTTAVKTYQPPKMPSSYIVDREGTIRFVHAGYEDGEENRIAAEVKQLLGK